MSAKENVETVKDFFAAAFGGDKDRLLALVADDIEWIIPGEDWPLAGTHRGIEGLTQLLETEAETMDMSLSEPREFVAQGDRVLVAGYAEGTVKATEKSFKDDWIFAITVRDGKLTNIREYVDTQALARASAGAQSGQLQHSPTTRATCAPHDPAPCGARLTKPDLYDQSTRSALTRFSGADEGLAVIDVYPGDGDRTRLFSDAVGQGKRVFGFVPTEPIRIARRCSIPPPSRA